VRHQANPQGKRKITGVVVKRIGGGAPYEDAASESKILEMLL